MPTRSQDRKASLRANCQLWSNPYPKHSAWENCPDINRFYTLQITPSSLTWLTKSFGEGHSQIIFSFSMQTQEWHLCSPKLSQFASRIHQSDTMWLGPYLTRLKCLSGSFFLLERLIGLVFVQFFHPASPSTGRGRLWRVETIQLSSETAGATILRLSNKQLSTIWSD